MWARPAQSSSIHTAAAWKAQKDGSPSPHLPTPPVRRPSPPGPQVPLSLGFPPPSCPPSSYRLQGTHEAAGMSRWYCPPADARQAAGPAGRQAPQILSTEWDVLCPTASMGSPAFHSMGACFTTLRSTMPDFTDGQITRRAKAGERAPGTLRPSSFVHLTSAVIIGMPPSRRPNPQTATLARFASAVSRRAIALSSIRQSMLNSLARELDPAAAASNLVCPCAASP